MMMVVMEEVQHVLVAVEEVRHARGVEEEVSEPLPFSEEVVEAPKEYLEQEAAVELVLDLGEGVVRPRVHDCQQKAAARQTWLPMISPRRVQVSLAVAEEVEDQDLQHLMRLALCLVELEEDLRTSQPLRLGEEP
jgi:hypothetical protein